MSGHEPTRWGGVRRTRIAQKAGQSRDLAEGSTTRGEGGAEALGKSATRIKWRRAVRIPHRVHIHLGEYLGLPDCPYVRRWRIDLPFGSIRVHHWLSHDDPRAVHDHPWWFLTFVVKGGYTDFTPGGKEHLRPGSIRYRPAPHQHTVVPDPGGCWTILITGRSLRKWGFWPKGKFIRANKFFLTYGHHPCD